MLRDFESADALLDEALAIAPERPWIWVEKSGVLEMEDRPEESIAAAQQALDLRPFYRPAVQTAAHCLVQMNRDQEAIALLTEAIDKLQSGDVIAQLAALQIELGRYDEARANFDGLEKYFPLMKHDKHRRQWLAARRADAAYYCGDIDEAVRLAKESDSPFHKQLVERLSDDSVSRQRTELAVPFVKQHHNTCGPATLSSVTQFWQQPVDHLDVVEKICYDGTPAHSERGWAEENGFVAREFRLNWETATKLLDLGLPFTLTTVDPGNAHLQAVHGYDERRGSLLVRDPGERHFGEFLAEKMFEHYAPCGPRGMVVIPAHWLGGNTPTRSASEESLARSVSEETLARRASEGAGDAKDDLQNRPTLIDPRIGAGGAAVNRKGFIARFQAIQLPEADLYDLNYRVELALQKHARDEAQATYKEMVQLDSNHRLTINARRAMAAYDADEPAMLKCAERLLAQFPDDVNLLMMKLSLLGQLGRRDARLEMLEEICAKPDADPFFWQSLAHELSVDAREYDKVYQLVRRSMRFRPLDERGMGLLADVMWDKPQQRNDALHLYRYAACLGDRDENRAKSYFFASRHLKKTDEALRFLEDRFRRFGGQKSWAAQTLVWAYEVLDRNEDALATVESALAMRPDDGELLLYAADFFSRYGQHEKARELLERARDDSHQTAWMRTAAAIETNEGNLTEALACWQKVLDAEPLARDANHMVAQLSADLQGPAAGRAHLQAAVQRFPHSYALWTMLLEWESAEGAEAAEATARKMLENWPVDGWARRELAIALVRLRKWDEAATEVELAYELEPTHPLCSFLRGKVHEAHGRIGQAKAAFRESVRLSVDYDPAIAALVEICDTQAEREVELSYIYDQLVEQVTFGDGLLTYRDFAVSTWPPEKIGQQLRAALAERPDLWQAYAALVRQLVDTEQLDEALEVAQQAAAKFPLLPRVWADLASVHQARGEAAAEIEALEKALQISPFFCEAARQLAEVLIREDRLDEAQAAIDRAVAGEPRDIYNQGTLGDVQWAKGEREAAIETYKQAVRTEPGYEYGWHRLEQCAEELGQQDVALEMFRELTRTRPDEARSWRMLAESLAGPETMEECLAAIDRALEIDPRHADTHAMKAFYLAESGQFDEALAACRPAIFGDEPPLELRARAADVHYHQGDYGAAIAGMKQVLDDDPNYAWGWMRLTGWYQELGENEAYLAAAKELARVAPRYPLAWAFLADAKHRADDRAGAKQDYAKARSIDPTYSVANLTLLDMHLEDKEIDETEKLLTECGEHLPPDYRALYMVRIDSAREQTARAMEHLRELCRCPMQDDEALRMAVGDMRDAERGGDAYEVLAELWHADDVAPQVAGVWVQVGAMLDRLAEVTAAVEAHKADSPRWHAAVQRLLAEIAGPKNVRVVHDFIKRHRPAINSDDATWAAAGNALYVSEDRTAALKWLSQWPTRKDIVPHMLQPLVYVLWETGCIDDALQTGQHAFDMQPDGSFNTHFLFYAMGNAVRGRGELAAQVIAQVNRAALVEPMHKLYDATETLIRLIETPASAPGQPAYGAAAKQLAAASAGIAAAIKEERVDAHLLHLSRAALAAHYGKSLAAAWHRMKAWWA